MCVKIAYDSRAQAKAEMRRLRSITQSAETRTPMVARSAYRCPKCEAWHLTSLSRAEQRRKGLR